MELTTNQIEILKEIQTMTEKFKADFKGKKIAFALLQPKHQTLHDNVEKLDILVKNHLTNASAKPEAEGVSLKKKEDIGTHQFSRDMERFIAELIAGFNTVKSSDETPMNVGELQKKFKKAFGEPLVAVYVYTALVNQLDSFQGVPTRANLATFLITFLENAFSGDGYWKKLLNKTPAWVKEYGKDKNLEEVLPRTESIIAVLTSDLAEDKNHAEHPGKKAAKAAEAAAKAEEDKAFLILFNEWKKDLANELGTKDNATDSNLVSLGKLMENLELRLGHTNMYSKPIADFILIQTREKILASKDSITVGELKIQLIPIIVAINKNIDWESQISLWKNNQDGFLFPIPSSIHTAIKEAKLEVSHQRFVQAFKDDIYNKHLSIIDKIAENKKWELVDDKKELPFNGKILKSELQIAFSRKIKSITPLEFIYNIIINNIGDDKMSLDDLKSSWGKSIQEAYEQAKDSSSSSIYGQMIAKKPLWEIELALDSFSAFAPTEAVMTAILEEARIVPLKKIGPKLHQYDESRTTNFSCSIVWDDVKSIFEIAGKEAANQSSLTKVTELLKTLNQGVRLVVEELEDVGGPFRLKIPDFTFNVKIPMKLVQYFDTSGNKIVAAIPNSLDSSDIKFNGDGGYFGFEVSNIEPLTELPKFLGKNPYVLSKDSDTCISEHQIKITADITDPQVEVSIGALGAVSLTKNPAKHTVDITLTLYSSYNLKENSVVTNIKSISYVGAEKVIRNVKVIAKEILKLEVFVE